MFNFSWLFLGELSLLNVFMWLSGKNNWTAKNKKNKEWDNVHTVFSWSFVLINPFILMHTCLDCQRAFKPDLQIHTKTDICGQLCVFMAFIKQVSQERLFLQQVCCVDHIQCSTLDTWQAAKCRYTCLLMDVDRWCVSVSSSTNYFWPIKSL